MTNAVWMGIRSKEQLSMGPSELSWLRWHLSEVFKRVGQPLSNLGRGSAGGMSILDPRSRKEARVADWNKAGRSRGDVAVETGSHFLCGIGNTGFNPE